MANTTSYADVLLPLAVAGKYTYRVPERYSDAIRAGKRVIVPFGSKKLYTAVVVGIHQNKPGHKALKDILELIDEKPVVNAVQLSFWKWISEYYLSPEGSVVNAALPGALKLKSESKIVAGKASESPSLILDEAEQNILEALHHRKSMSISEAAGIVGSRHPISLIKSMIERSLLIMEEEVMDRYKPKTDYFVRLTEDYQSEQMLQEIFDKLGNRAFKQLQLLISYISLSRNSDGSMNEIRRADLVKSVDASYQQLNQLVKKGILQVYEKTVNRLESPEAVSDPLGITFNEQQTLALQRIRECFKTRSTVLLHGVTSSGKTEIYIRLIEQTLKSGKQVLYLLPEIALTTQIINRLRKYFGNKIGIFHSRYNEHEQVEVWKRVLNTRARDHYPVIIGARSAMFLPFSKLGLVIVDEEHDTSYKQQDPAPRYNARDCAVYLGGLHGANIILGSATPSFESYHNCQTGKFKLVEVTGRYLDMQMPEIHLVDLKKEPRIRQGKSHYSRALLDEIERVLKEKRQVILFQNRRGFSLRIECNECHYVPMCINCDISLTYHKNADQLRCHYCGYHTHLPLQCPECGGRGLLLKGFGTEKIEEEIGLLFPDCNIQRMDLDTTRSRYAYQRIINDFEQGNIDILIGTQMITKGLDFDHVNLVGIMNADSMINFPDFRSYERSFQLMTQVSGRSGRKHKRGHVFIQTYDPYHMVIQHVLNNDYRGFFRLQMQDRLQFRYPPYYRLILLHMIHRDYKVLNRAARDFAEDLRSQTDQEVLGPEYPLVSRMKNHYIKNILIKAEKGPSLSRLKEIIKDRTEHFKQNPLNNSINLQVDVDPL